MKILIQTIKEMKFVLSSLETALNEEHKNLLKINSNLKLLKTIIKKKTMLFNSFSVLSQNRLSIEQKYDISTPYIHHKELKKDWIDIVSKCSFLRELNRKNKVLLNQKIYLNQNFLELFSTYKKCTTYNINGNLKI